MAISDTITSIEDNLRADYEGLENIGADLTGINKNILNIRTILDTIYNDMPKVTGEGTEVTLTPTRKGRLALIPKGNSTQESTNGYQLFNFTNIYTQGANIIAPTINNGIIHVQGENNSGYSDLNYRNGYFTCTDVDPNVIETNVRYYVSAKIEILQNPRNISQFQVLIGGHGELPCLISLSQVTGRYEGSFVATERTYLDRRFIEFRVGSCELNISEIMISSTQNANYEQYTNGPAPNPSYPFPIKSVTGNNNVVVQNKNIFDVDNLPFENAYYDNNGVINSNINNGLFGFIKVTPNTNYTFSVKQSVLNICIVEFTLAQAFIKRTIVSNASYNAVQLSSTTEYVRISMNTTNRQVVTRQIIKDLNPMLEQNSTATTYEAYTQITKPLNLGTKKVMLGDTMQDNGIHHVRGRIRLNTTNFDISQHEYGTTLFYLNKKGTTAEKRFYNGPEGFCTHYKMNTTGDIKGDASAFSYLNVYECALRNSDALNNRERLYIKLTENDTIQTLSTFLDNNEVYLEYTLKEADYYTESYTTEQQAQWNDIQKMKSYEGTTIITSTFDENNSQMIISASGLKGE